jgi:3-oxoacyl-[acyl-carrier protein] reductase
MGAGSDASWPLGPEVANTASKSGLRGAALALHLSLRSRAIAVTLINPDNVATPEVLTDMEEGRFGPQRPIPLSDLCATIDYILHLSPDTVPTSIQLGQMT